MRKQKVGQWKTLMKSKGISQENLIAQLQSAENQTAFSSSNGFPKGTNNSI